MIIQGESITECWLKALIEIVDGTSSELSPVVANFKANARPPTYQDDLENELNCYLKGAQKNTIETTASTIFPKSLAGGSPQSLYERFDNIWPYIKKETKNRNGHYFRRLVAYNEKNGKPINQLKHIIDTYNGTDTRNPVHRRSALIALTFDPTKDHTSQSMRGFPCLQQVCFVPKGKNLTLNAVYAMQYLCERAYGNYVGLQNLGNFMAAEMGLELSEVNCIASVLEMKMTKYKARKIAEKYRDHV